ncbi:hypothetical protein HCC61_14515 [Streptomyces sp. HNM0575]|uniref:DUF6879 family protein n=1 Tax=Streptomyces sp. HNM0575 TaxID=2716338 RepID=UPI00145C7AC4|nr:DUF6879 family protein [Streptomyces sp. HNM0575]NLU73878.1 hypothetical protein [Streptomyces sp. HNM0575]
MLDLRVPSLPSERGEPLDDDAYVSDFRKRRRAVHNAESWKLERLQHFEEEESPTRDALRRGDWPAVLRLVEDGREAAERAAEDDRRRNSPFLRLRVVEEPLTPYMQWELHWLKMRAEAGHRTRVLPAEDVGADETGGLLPEIVILGGRVLYQLLYDGTGTFESAVRFTAPEVVDPWVNYVKQASDVAEDIRTYFDRAVAHLPPPPAA